MPEERVRLEIDGRVATLVLSRPEVLNALDQGACDEIVAALDTLESRGDVSILTILGEGRAFCAGADLKHMRALESEQLRRFIERTWIVGERINRSPILSIAAIHGFALGGGAELALACDLRLCEADATMGFPEMTLGSVPGSGAMQRLHALVGPSVALELVVEGRRIGGSRAGELGLVNRVVGPGEARNAASEWAHSLSQRPPEAIRYAKMCMRLPVDGAVAPMVHGLVSSICQSASDYRQRAGAVVSGKETTR
jgi:enoyl-CoA hydratase